MADQQYADLWTSAQTRVLDLLDGAGEAAATTPVPATPGWDVKAVISHVVGVAADVVAGTADPDISEAWTQGHVDQRASASMAQILDEWRALAPEVLALMPDAPVAAATSLVVDLTTHEQDLRGALQVPGGRTDPALDLGVRAFGGALAKKVSDGDLAPVRLVGDRVEILAPEGSHPVVTGQASTYELHRALSGRRSAAQVRSLDWTGDPEPYLAIFSRFGDLRDDDLVE